MNPGLYGSTLAGTQGTQPTGRVQLAPEATLQMRPPKQRAQPPNVSALTPGGARGRPAATVVPDMSKTTAQRGQGALGGAVSGATLGGTLTGGNPIGIAAGAIIGGALGFFS